jgi:hypothetical protein
MDRSLLLKIAAFVGVTSVVLLAVAWYWRGGPGVGPVAPTTKLVIEVSGGFAYVAPTGSDNHLEIAYLNDFVLWNDANGNGTMEPNEIEFDDLNNNGRRDPGEPDMCNVNQIGSELKVTKGTIISHDPSTQPLPASKEFNLDKAVVKFPALETANIPLTIGNLNWPPPAANPLNADVEAEWADMVPALLKHHTTSVIDPNWRTMVNGRVVLPGGLIKAAIPSSPIFKKARFDFKANHSSKFKAAMTDRTKYTVDVPAGTVEIQLSGAANGFTRLVIQPQGNTVELTLRGMHDMGSSIPGDGAPLKDFCAFYQLMQPRPDKKEFLVPHYIAAAGGTGGGGGLPSPGFFCPGEWF